MVNHVFSMKEAAQEMLNSHELVGAVLVDETSLQKPWMVHRHYYVNNSCPEFRRMVTFIKDMA